MTRMIVLSRCAALAAPLLLAACGGGGSSGGGGSNVVPASVGDSSASFNQYVGALPSSETTEPLALGALLPPTSDTTEPSAL